MSDVRVSVSKHKWLVKCDLNKYLCHVRARTYTIVCVRIEIKVR